MQAEHLTNIRAVIVGAAWCFRVLLCSPSLGSVAMAAVGPDGRLLLGPDGQGLLLGPDRLKLLTASGRPLLSDKGTQLGLAANGECLLPALLVVLRWWA